MTETLEQVSQQLAALRYQVSHEGELLDHATTALRLCRDAITADHCAGCRAAWTLASEVLRALAAGEESE